MVVMKTVMTAATTTSMVNINDHMTFGHLIHSTCERRMGPVFLVYHTPHNEHYRFNHYYRFLVYHVPLNGLLSSFM